MSRLGGEKISRLVVGLFALVLTGGLAAFFGGYLYPLLGTQEKTVVKPPMPFAKPPAATTKHAPVDNPAPTATVAPAIPTAPALVPAPQTVAVTSPAPVETAIKVTATANPDITQPIASTAKETQATPNPIKKSAPTQARGRDLDLRHCLDLPTEMEMAQCAYKLP
jgi:hypothetical protein